MARQARQEGREVGPVQPSPIIERLAKLPRGQRFLLYIGLYVLADLYVFTVYYPSMSELDTLKSNREN